MSIPASDNGLLKSAKISNSGTVKTKGRSIWTLQSFILQNKITQSMLSYLELSVIL